MVGSEAFHIPTHNHIPPARNRSSRRKGKGNPLLQTPTVQIHRLGRSIVYFDKLIGVIVRDRMVHDLIEHHVLDPARRIGLSGSKGFQSSPTRSPVGSTTRSHPIFLSPKANNVEDPHSIRTHQPNALARGAQPKTESLLVQHQKSSRHQHRTGRNPESVGLNIIGQHTARQVRRLGAAIVKLHRVKLRQVGMGQHFIDHHF